MKYLLNLHSYLAAFVVTILFTTSTLLGWSQGSENLKDDFHNPSLPLLEILSLYNICHDGSWPSIQQATEKAWLSHGRNVERWEIPSIAHDELNKSYDLFAQLGMINCCYPEKKYYDYGVVLGATLQRVRQRLWTLKQMWGQGVRFSTLVILTGDRPLNHDFESAKYLIDPCNCPYPFRPNWHFKGKLPTNETEMVLLVLDQLDLPQEWQDLPTVVVDTPKPTGFRRPCTEHTVLHWLTLDPKPGSILCISNQPYVCRQDAIVSKYLPPIFNIETVGDDYSYQDFLNEPRSISVILAELAYRIKILTSPQI